MPYYPEKSGPRGMTVGETPDLVARRILRGTEISTPEIRDNLEANAYASPFIDSVVTRVIAIRGLRFSRSLAEKK